MKQFLLHRVDYLKTNCLVLVNLVNLCPKNAFDSSGALNWIK